METNKSGFSPKIPDLVVLFFITNSPQGDGNYIAVNFRDDAAAYTAVFHNQFPARGWKLATTDYQKQQYAKEAAKFFITNSPQGDGNPSTYSPGISSAATFFITNSPQGDGNCANALL